MEWDDYYRQSDVRRLPWYTEKPEPLLSELVRKGKIRRGTVFDMCSGAGTNSIYLASKGFEVYGADISPVAVSVASKRCSDKGYTCNYFVGDVVNMPIDRRFDFVFDRGCFHHIPDEEKPRYVEKVFSILDNDGQFFLQCFSDRNKENEKALTKEDIYGYFIKFFDIMYLRESIHKEPDSGNMVHLYSVFMRRR
jgi:SAM-dependent methyltransferase